MNYLNAHNALNLGGVSRLLALFGYNARSHLLASA